MFIIMVNYKKPLEIVDQYVAAHRAYMDQGYTKDFFVTSGPRNPRVGGVVVSQLKDRAILETFFKDDPYYVNGVADFEIIEFAPVKNHPEFLKFIE
jgi:uncharacterized protein YciI